LPTNKIATASYHARSATVPVSNIFLSALV
jgi:hypothetical protein